MKRKLGIKVGLFVLAMLLLLYGVKHLNKKEKQTAELKKHIIWESDIEKAKIIDDRIVFWDGDFLVSLDQDGTVKEKVDHLKESLTPFFTDHYCFLYDGQMNKLYQYDGKGTLKNTIEVEGSLFNIVE